MSKAPHTSLICAALSIGLSIQPAVAGIPTHLEPVQPSQTSVLHQQGAPMASSWAQVRVKNGRIGTHLPPGSSENGRIGTHLPPGSSENGRIGTHLPPAESENGRIGTHLPPGSSEDGRIGTHLPPGSSENGRIGTHLPPAESENGRIGTHLPPESPEDGRHNPNDGDDDHSEPIDYRFTFEVTRLELGPEGIPCLVEVEGSVLKRNGNQKPVGSFEAGFYDCPTYQPLPEELADNIFGIPAGTVMPAWDGTVTYFLKKGSLLTEERAWIFPAGPNGELGVLSVAHIEGGTGYYEDTCGKIITPDGYEDAGSLLGELHFD